MFHIQTGDQPRAARIIGLFIFIYALGEILYLLLHWINVPLPVAEPEKPAFLFFALLTFAEILVMLWFGAIIIDLFPEIKIDESGITVKNLFSTDHFPWNEMKEVTNAGGIFKGSKAITLHIHAISLSNKIKFFPYLLHGMMASVTHESVILLSDGLIDRELIQKEISRHVPTHIKNQPT